VRISEVFLEAGRNVASGASRPLFLLTGFMLMLLLGLTLGAQLTANAMLTYASYNVNGASTTVIRALGGVDPRACARLSTLRGVTGAVAMRQRGSEVRVAVLPRFGQPDIEVFGDLFGVLGGEASGVPGILLSRPFADQLGLRAGSPFALTDGASRVAGVFNYPDDGRQQVLANAVVVPTPNPEGAFDECWVTVWPPDPRLAALHTSVLLGQGQSGGVEFQLLNGTLGEPKPLLQLFEESHVQTVKLAGVVGSLLLGFVWLLTRRLDLAVALHVGQSRCAQVGQVLSEALSVALIAASAVVVGTLLVVGRGLSMGDFAILAVSTVARAVAALGGLVAGILMAHLTVHATKFGDWAKDR
jgi:hypothetical protein